MKIELKENVVYETFDNKKDLQEKILSMIIKSKTDKILYKGDPNLIDYKLMKKVMLKNYTERIDPEIVRLQYKDVVNLSENKKYCIIYKENKKTTN